MNASPKPQRLVFEDIAKYLPPERVETYFRVLSRIKHLNPNDDLVVVLEAMGIYAWLTRDAPDRMASERHILMQLLDDRIERCQSLLHESNYAVLRKMERADQDLSEARRQQRITIDDFRRHIDARVERAQGQMDVLVQQIENATFSLKQMNERSERFLTDVKSTHLRSRLMSCIALFALGVGAGLALK